MLVPRRHTTSRFLMPVTRVVFYGYENHVLDVSVAVLVKENVIIAIKESLRWLSPMNYHGKYGTKFSILTFILNV